MQRVWVGAEWDTLKEAIVGIAANVSVPLWTDEYEFVPEDEQKFVREHGGKLLSEVAPQRHHRMSDQLDQLAGFLTGVGVRVHRPRVISEDEDQFLAHIRDCRQQLFPRDPVIVIGDHVIEGSLRDPMERKYRWAIRDLLFTGSGDPLYDMNFSAIPEPQPVVALSGFGPGPFLEGGDVMVCNNRIFIGESGHASNEWGMRCLRQCIGPEYKLIKVPLNSSVLHLDCALSLPREGLAIACLEAMPEGLPKFFSDWDVIEVSLEEASYLACNGLVVDENHYLCAAEHPRIAEALSRAGHTVSVIEFDALASFGGGLRCAHHPLRREVGKG